MFSGAVKVREKTEPDAGRDWADSAAVIPGGIDPRLRLTGPGGTVLGLSKMKLTVMLCPL
jgi:hypothetical protein